VGLGRGGPPCNWRPTGAAHLPHCAADDTAVQNRSISCINAKMGKVSAIMKTQKNITVRAASAHLSGLRKAVVVGLGTLVLMAAVGVGNSHAENIWGGPHAVAPIVTVR